MTEKYIIRGTREEVAPIFRALGEKAPTGSDKYEVKLTREQRDRALLIMKCDGTTGAARRSLETYRKTDRLFDRGINTRGYGYFK